MPNKQPSLFGSSFVEPPKEKLPTLLQYLKANKDIDFPLLSRINYIWLPGSFNSFTLETELFRVLVSDRNPLYGVLNGKGWGTIVDTDTAILVSCLDVKGTFELVESNVYGKYDPIGNHGVKFKATVNAT